MGRTIEFFSSFAACIAISRIMKGSPQVGGFQVGSSLTPLNLVSKVCSVFSEMDATSISERQPRAIAIAYNILGGSWTPLANNSKGGFLCLVVEFFVRETMTLERK